MTGEPESPQIAAGAIACPGDGDDVIMYASWSKFSRDENQQYDGLQPQAVRQDSDGISITWVEFFQPPPPSIHQACQAIVKGGTTIRKSGVFAIARAGKIRAIAREMGLSIQIERDPVPGNDGHALIKGWSTELVDLLASVFERSISPEAVPGLLGC